MAPTFKTVGSYKTAIEAHAVKNFLESRSIQAFVRDEFTAYEGWSNYQEARVEVAVVDIQRAQHVLQSVRR